MSEDKTDTGATEPDATETPEDGSAEEKGGTTTLSPHNPLSRPTDTTLRPGFRNPANKRSKSQKKKRRKKRK